MKKAQIYLSLSRAIFRCALPLDMRFNVAIKSYIQEIPNSNEHWLLFKCNCLKEILCLTCNCLKEVIGMALIRKPRRVD